MSNLEVDEWFDFFRIVSHKDLRPVDLLVHHIRLYVYTELGERAEGSVDKCSQLDVKVIVVPGDPTKCLSVSEHTHVGLFPQRQVSPGSLAIIGFGRRPSSP